MTDLSKDSIRGFDYHGFLRISQDPTRTQEILDITKKMAEHPSIKDLMGPLAAIALKNESLLKLYRDKFIPRFPTSEELNQFPEKSLGKELALHLNENNISLEFAGLDTSRYYENIQTPIDYLRMRALRCHDIFHVLSGLGTSFLDEYALGAFQYAQFASPYHSVVMASGLIHFTFYKPLEVPHLMNKMTQFYEIGKKCPLWLGIPWELYWERPLAELQKEYFIQE